MGASNHARTQGNMDPGVLFGSKQVIEARVMDVIKKARSQGVRCGLAVGFEQGLPLFLYVARCHTWSAGGAHSVGVGAGCYCSAATMLATAANLVRCGAISASKLLCIAPATVTMISPSLPIREGT
jgi:hypothetical protein